MTTKSDPKLIYDVGMHNGDDTAYYLWRGFRVVAIEPNPELVATAANRRSGSVKPIRALVHLTDAMHHWTASTPSMKLAFLAENSARFLMTLAYLST